MFLVKMIFVWMITKIHIIDVALGLLLRRVKQDEQDRTGQGRQGIIATSMPTPHSNWIKPTTTMAKEARRAWNQTQQWSSAMQL